MATESPIVNPQGGALAVSTLVYHTGVNSINAGYYYWDGTRWLGLVNDTVYSTTNKGLQYFVFTGGSVPPNIDKQSFSMTNFSSGLWSGLLDDTARNSLRGTNTDNYSMLFEGKLIVETSGNFQLQSTSDDGARVIIDGIPVLNRWQNQSNTVFNGSTVFFTKGKHRIEFWYYESAQGEFMQFNWLQNANGATGIVQANSFIIE